MLRAVVDGELGGAATDAFGDRAVVYGGVDAQGAPSEVGLVLWADGRSERFETALRLVEPSVALTGERLVVAGRRCDSPAVDTDQGIECEPGTAAAVWVDLASKQVTPIELGIEGLEGSSRADVLRYGVDGDVAVHVIGDGWSRLLRAAADGSVARLPDQEGPIYCGTETALYAARPSEAEVPPRERPPSVGAHPVEAHPPELAEIRVGGDAWRDLRVDDVTASGYPGCTQRYLVVPEVPSGAPVAIDAEGSVTSFPDLEVGYLAGVVASPSSDRFAIRAVDRFLLLDAGYPESGLEEVQAPDQLDGKLVYPVILLGDVWFIGPSGLLPGE